MIHRLRRFRKNEFDAQLSNNPGRDSRARNEEDNLAVARCPLCGHRLVARLDCQGPYFFCLCVKQRQRAAA
jgi:ssDNA-binding Zn-finger/Zn-ribbon topoisomerase 1